MSTRRDIINYLDGLTEDPMLESSLSGNAKFTILMRNGDTIESRFSFYPTVLIYWEVFDENSDSRINCVDDEDEFIEYYVSEKFLNFEG